MNIGPYSFTIRAAIIAIGIGLLAVSLIFGVRSCEKRRSMAAQAKVEKAQTGAVLESGMDSSKVQSDIAANDMAAGDLNRKNAEDIRNAEGSNAVVAADARAAWLRAICQRKANLNRPECRVQ